MLSRSSRSHPQFTLRLVHSPNTASNLAVWERLGWAHAKARPQGNVAFSHLRRPPSSVPEGYIYVGQPSPAVPSSIQSTNHKKRPTAVEAVVAKQAGGVAGLPVEAVVDAVDGVHGLRVHGHKFALVLLDRRLLVV